MPGNGAEGSDGRGELEELRDEIARLRTEVARLKVNAIAFGVYEVPESEKPPERPKFRLIKGGLGVGMLGLAWVGDHKTATVATLAGMTAVAAIAAALFVFDAPRDEAELPAEIQTSTPAPAMTSGSPTLITPSASPTSPGTVLPTSTIARSPAPTPFRSLPMIAQTSAPTSAPGRSPTPMRTPMRTRTRSQPPPTETASPSPTQITQPPTTQPTETARPPSTKPPLCVSLPGVRVCVSIRVPQPSKHPAPGGTS